MRTSSSKRAELRKRRHLAAFLLAERGPWCEAGLAGCTGRWQDMHEQVRRSQGGDPLDADNILLLCRACHRWVTEHPVEARRRNLAGWGWER